MQERRNATLVILHHDGDARMLREIEGSGTTYPVSSRESARPCVIAQAPQSLLKKELSEIHIIVNEAATIEKVAKRFAIELAKKPGGKLAYDDQFGLGLCEIIG